MLDGHSAVLWSGNIYIWGGKEFDGPSSHAARRATTAYSNVMHVLNPSDCLSKPSATLERLRLGDEGTTQGSPRQTTGFVPNGRAFHNAVLYGKLMLITGGLTEESEQSADLSNIPAFDLERRIWAMKTSFGDVPCARCHHVSVVYGDTLFVHGGYPVLNERHRELTTEEVGSIQHAMYEAHELNISTMRWRRIHTQHSPSLWGHTAISYNKNIVVFGGVDVVENCEAGSVAVWHTEKKQWRWADFENLELRCALHSAVQDGGRMFVFSGISFRSHSKLRSLYEFNLEFGSWRELNPKGAPPLGRVGHCAVVYNQCMLVIGGTVENPGDPSGATNGLPERAVHLYNTSLNEWRTCALVPPSSEVVDAGPRFAHKEKSWSSRNLDPTVQGAVKEEWDQTAQQVKETIARAKAIQSLADAAHTTGNTSSQPAGGGGGGSPNYQPMSGASPINPNQSGGGGMRPMNIGAEVKTAGGLPVEHVVPFDDNRRIEQQQNHQSPQSQPRRESQARGGEISEGGRTPFGQNLSGTQTEASPAENAIDKVSHLRQGLTNEESRRVVEQLQKENERLRMQLEETRRIGDPKNPYEVPVYNAASTVLAADEGVNTSAQRSRLGQNSLGENVPRLNLNAAEPPRAVAGAGGFMGRGAVSALVQSSLNDISATSSLAAVQPPNSSIGTRSLDPMSFLTQPTYAQQQQGAGAGGQPWHPSSYQPPQNYDQLLARANSEHISSNTSVPLALQPLLPLLGGPNATVNTGTTYQVQGATPQAPLPHQTTNLSPAVPRSADVSAVQNAPTSRNTNFSPAGGGGGPPATTKAPSLNKLVTGGSMLSLPGSRRFS